MIHEFRKITIVKIRKPVRKDINKDLQWFSESIGLFSERDKEKSCFRVFIELIKATRKKQPISSDEISHHANLSRGTVVHHLNKLMESGLVVNLDSRYILSVDNLEELIEIIKENIIKTLNDLKRIAEDIDDELGLIRR